MNAKTCLGMTLAIAIAALGCAEQETRVSVAGRVLVDGEPLTTGTIRFVPESGRAVSSAISSDGSFRLSTASVSAEPKQKGVLPGRYRIAVSASKILGEEAASVEWLAPSRYADFSTSGLEADLQSDTDDLSIELTWEGEDVTDDDENMDEATEDADSDSATPQTTTIEPTNAQAEE